MTSKVDVLFVDLESLEEPEQLGSVEASTLMVGEDNPAYTRFCNIITNEMVRALEAEKYDVIVFGTAGPITAQTSATWHGTPYISLEEVASGQLEFPNELHVEIDRIVVEQISVECQRLVHSTATR